MPLYESRVYTSEDEADIDKWTLEEQGGAPNEPGRPPRKVEVQTLATVDERRRPEYRVLDESSDEEQFYNVAGEDESLKLKQDQKDGIIESENRKLETGDLEEGELEEDDYQEGDDNELDICSGQEFAEYEDEEEKDGQYIEPEDCEQETETEEQCLEEEVGYDSLSSDEDDDDCEDTQVGNRDDYKDDSEDVSQDDSDSNSDSDSDSEDESQDCESGDDSISEMCSEDEEFYQFILDNKLCEGVSDDEKSIDFNQQEVMFAQHKEKQQEEEEEKNKELGLACNVIVENDEGQQRCQEECQDEIDYGYLDIDSDEDEEDVDIDDNVFDDMLINGDFDDILESEIGDEIVASMEDVDKDVVEDLEVDKLFKNVMFDGDTPRKEIGSSMYDEVFEMYANDDEFKDMYKEIEQRVRETFDEETAEKEFGERLESNRIVLDNLFKVHQKIQSTGRYREDYLTIAINDILAEFGFGDDYFEDIINHYLDMDQVVDSEDEEEYENEEEEFFKIMLYMFFKEKYGDFFVNFMKNSYNSESSEFYKACEEDDRAYEVSSSDDSQLSDGGREARKKFKRYKSQRIIRFRQSSFDYQFDDQNRPDIYESILQELEMEPKKSLVSSDSQVKDDNCIGQDGSIEGFKFVNDYVSNKINTNII